jgi:hypothetical protein
LGNTACAQANKPRGNPSKCVLCRFFTKIRPSSTYSFELLALSSRTFQSDAQPGENRAIYDTTLLTLFESRYGFKSPRPIHGHLRRDIESVSLISQLNEPNQPTREVFGMEIQSDKASFESIQYWLSYCQHHGLTCSTQSQSFVTGLKFIDCRSRKIILATSDLRYLTLSYVWGLESANASRSSVDSLLPDSLPQVISDAISVTQALGLNYLWVDRYCIDGSDADEIHTQPQLMGSIYRNVEATIVAAAGTISTFGLPGAGFRSHHYQPSVILGSHTMISTFPNSKTVISKSKCLEGGHIKRQCYHGA